jgi:hypothetical protein
MGFTSMEDWEIRGSQKTFADLFGFQSAAAR